MQVTAEVPAQPEAIAKLRRFATVQLLEAGCPIPAIERVRLLVSELATNALVHAGADPIRLVLTFHPDDAVVIDVRDPSPEEPFVEEPSPDRLRGRGLHLVDALADEWGVRWCDDGEGKDVWCTLHLAAARSAEPSV